MAGLARAVFPLLAALFCIGYVAGAATGAALGRWAAMVVLLLTGVLLLLGISSCSRRIGAFFKGAAGEEIVACELARLAAGYHVFHSLDAGGGVLMWHSGDVDHVVVGPTGIFVIETKNWRGSVTVADGRLQVDGTAPHRDPLEQARQAASKLQVRFGKAGIYHATVVPVVCFASDCFTAGTQTVGEVVVCNAESLRGMLTDPQRRGAMPVNAEAIAGALARPA